MKGKKNRHNSDAGKTNPVTIWMLEKQNPSQFGWMKTKLVTIWMLENKTRHKLGWRKIEPQNPFYMGWWEIITPCILECAISGLGIFFDKQPPPPEPNE